VHLAIEGIVGHVGAACVRCKITPRMLLPHQNHNYPDICIYCGCKKISRKRASFYATVRVQTREYSKSNKLKDVGLTSSDPPFVFHRLNEGRPNKGPDQIGVKISFKDAGVTALS
jgi:hypothetical protein